MPRRSKKHYTRAQQLPIQDSPFLRFPPELRNTIYEYAARNSETIDISLDGILYVPALSLTCRQVREEYQEIYLDEAPKYASGVRINLTNFIHRTMTRDVAKVRDELPQLVIGHEREYTLRILLTNTFDHYLGQLRSLRFPPYGNYDVSDENPFSTVDICYDPRTFDVDYCRQLMKRLRWTLGENSSQVAGREWRSLEKGFEMAFKRYGNEVTETGRQRKRRNLG